MRKLTIVVGLLLAANGCTTTVGGSGAEATWDRINGRLRADLPVPLHQAEKATRAALEGLEFVGIEGAIDRLEGEVSARMADGKRVSVRLNAIDFENTAISIKVGSIGDRSISQQILRHVRQQAAAVDGSGG